MKIKSFLCMIPVFLLVLISTTVTVNAASLPDMNVVYDADSNAIIVEGLPQFVDGFPCQINGNISYNGQNLGSFCFGAEYISYVNEEKKAWLYDLSHMAPDMREPGTLVFSATVSLINNNAAVDSKKLSLSVDLAGSTEAIHYPIQTNSIALEDYNNKEQLLSEGIAAVSEKLWDATSREEIIALEDAFSKSCGVDYTFEYDAVDEVISPDSVTVTGVVLNANPNRTTFDNETICLNFSKANDGYDEIDGMDLLLPLKIAIIEADTELTEWTCPVYISFALASDLDPALVYITDDKGNAISSVVNDNMISIVVEQPGTIVMSASKASEDEGIELLDEEPETDIMEAEESAVESNGLNILPIAVGVIALIILVAVAIMRR